MVSKKVRLGCVDLGRKGVAVVCLTRSQQVYSKHLVITFFR